MREEIYARRNLCEKKFMREEIYANLTLIRINKFRMFFNY